MTTHRAFPAAARRLARVSAALLSTTVLLAESETSRAPEDAIGTFELAPGFQIELIVSEPLISDPVAMEIDENGALYVVEMPGYPLDLSGSGNIKRLSDTDGDGRMDESVLFADGLRLPTGIMRWKNGVLVTDPPDVLYLEDSDGDGKADLRETVLTGFAVSNPQHNTNNPLLGIDNWIYLAHEPATTTKLYPDLFGDRGGEIHFPSQPDGPRLPENAGGHSVRFRPDRRQLESTSSSSQFGHTFDQWGRRLLVTNWKHVYHEVISARYLNRAPELPVSQATESISDHGPAAEVFPITRNAEHQLLTDVGVFTSACGLTAYSGALFPESFNDVTFVAEPVSNLIHADRLRPAGATFTASRVYEDREFLASTDPWFRPVNMYIGPDGALYVVDYYRQIIEHPEWMAEEAIQSGKLDNGRDKGRVYRITPTGTPPADWSNSISLGDATIEQLVGHLSHPTIWWRRNAQRLLLDRGGEEAAPALEQLARNADAPLGRLHALWTLQGMDRLRSELITHALRDAAPGVRENAAKLAEINLDQNPGLANALQDMQNDPDARVRFQVLCSLGFIDTDAAARARENILFTDVEDPWAQIAALTAVNLREGDLLDAALARYQPDLPAYDTLVQRLAAIIGSRSDQAAIRSLIGKATRSRPENGTGWQSAILAGLAEGMNPAARASSALDEERNQLVDAVFSHDSESVRKASIQFLDLIGLPTGSAAQGAARKATRMAADPTEQPDRRIEAIRFLALHAPEANRELFQSLLEPGEPLPVQLEALQAFSSIGDSTVSRHLLEKWSTLTPELRDAAIDTFLVNRERIALLVDALESGLIQTSSIGWRRSVRLMNQSDPHLRARSRALLARLDSSRSDVVSGYQAAVDETGDYDRGRILFAQHCASCHQVGGEAGVAFGPDLGMIRNRAPGAIIADILDPNLSIADGYDLWIVELDSGETLQGVISSESPTALTVRNQAGLERTIARQNIDSLKPLGISAMPAGMEAYLEHGDMADLLAFLKSRAPQPPQAAMSNTAKPTAEHNPQPVRPDSEGKVRLTAERGQAYGPEIKYMPEWRAFGWFTARDHVEWEVTLTKPTVYEVFLEWSVSDEEAGKPFALVAGDSRLDGVVAPTGSWETFKTKKIGEIRLPAGRQTLSFRPASHFEEGALLDLREIRLIPKR